MNGSDGCQTIRTRVDGDLYATLNRKDRLAMKPKTVFATLCVVICQFSIHLYESTAIAAGSFFCSGYGGYPATMKSTSSGRNVPVILWKSNVFSADGWSPEKRCQEVSQRFEQLHQSGRLRYLTTGRMNGLPIICAAISEGGGCVEGGLLYTLKPGQNAGQTLTNLLAIRVKATGPLTESTARPYISLEQIEQTAISNESTTPEVQKSVETTEQPSSSNSKQLKKSANHDVLW